jgi:hypothetical protein
VSRHTVTVPAEVTQIGRLCLIVHSEGVPPDLCCHTNYQSASTRTLHWHSGWHRGIAPLSEAEPGPPNCAGTPLQRTDIFFFVRSSVGGCGRSGPRPPRSSRACRAVLPGRRHRTHPPATSSPLLALAPRCASAVSLCNPATAVSTSGQWRLQHQEWRKNAARHAQR